MTQADQNSPSVSSDVEALLASAAKGNNNAALYPHAAAIAEQKKKDAAAAEKRRKENEIKNAKPGDYVEGCGVFIGAWTPLGANGKKLGPTFNIFTTKEDLRAEKDPARFDLEKFKPVSAEPALYAPAHQTFTYHGAAAAVSQMNEEQGYDVRSYDDDAALYAALKDGSYGGQWIIPPRELVDGFSLRKPDAPHFLYKYRGEGSLSDTFVTECPDDWEDDVYPQCYWSCTTSIWSENEGKRAAVSFAGDGMSMLDMKQNRASIRPVRLEPVKAQP
jgi:hypothetical protein